MSLKQILLLLQFLVPLAVKAQQYSWTNFVGQPGYEGFADGTGTAARFMNPHAVAIDASGSLLVADGARLRKVSPAGVVTTVASTTSQIYGVAVDSAGNAYMADTGKHTILKVAPNGTVSIIAGAPDQSGSSDGLAGAARFSSPHGIAVDATGNLIVADTNNHTIRRISENGLVETIAGSSGQRGSVDGLRNAARFDTPKGVAVDTGGNVFVADYQTGKLRKVTQNGDVSTISGFGYIHGISIDQAGNIFLTGQQTHTITKISAFGNSVVIGGNGSLGNVSGIGSNARFQYPDGVAVDRSGVVYVADTNNNRISKGVPIGPYLEPTPASAVSVTTATINGRVNPNGYSTTVWFEYGLTTAYGSTVGVALSPANGTGNQNVSVQLIGLLPETTYHYRLKATSIESTAYSAGMTFKTLAGTPEIEVEQPAGNALLDGSATVDFGGSPIGGSSVKTFTIRNTGTASLTGLSIGRTGVNASNFSIGSLVPNTIPAGSSRTFTVTFNPNAQGPRSALLSIASDDADENPFEISLTGIGLAADIQIEQQSSGLLVDGSSIVDFGIVPPGYQVTHTFSITNTGELDLTGITASVTGLSAVDYTITRLPPSMLTPGSRASFTVRFAARAADAPSATLRIASNDPDENPFDITLTGKAVGAEIAVEQPAGKTLVDGAAFIHFGSIGIGTPVIRNFRLRNVGNIGLTGIIARITGANSSDFSLAAIPPDTLAPGAIYDFGVRFVAGGGGSRTAQFSITSSDSDENPFEVELIATGLSIYEDWRLGHFGVTENEGVAADIADPDGDGLVNLLEYALGGNPLKALSAPSPTVEMDAASGRLELKFNRFTDRNDLTLVVEGADNAAGPWTGLARSSGGDAFVALLGGVGIAEAGTGLSRTVAVLDPFAASSSVRRFLRLRVTRQ